MITLLMALFIVMFAVSVVDQKKFDEVARSLQQAFSGKVMEGGGSIRPNGNGDDDGATTPVAAVAAIAPLVPVIAPEKDLPRETAAKRAARREEQELAALKRRIDAWIDRRGLGRRVETALERRGLVIRVITDDVLFPSGSATLSSDGRALLDDIAGVLRLDSRHPIAVEGHTDAVPISTARFASNWELSAGRATEVVRHLVGRSIAASRFSATGYGEQRPRANNATDVGRRANRRVEIALTRLETPTP